MQTQIATRATHVTPRRLITELMGGKTVCQHYLEHVQNAKQVTNWKAPVVEQAFSALSV